MRRNLFAALVGVGFGFVLVAARLNEFNTIHAMLLLREPDVFLLMGSPVATAAPILILLERFQLRTAVGEPLRVERQPVERHTVLGALLFGAGWAVTGACPGPALAMTATGTVMGAPLMGGLMVGATLRDRIASRTAPASSATAGSAINA